MKKTSIKKLDLHRVTLTALGSVSGGAKSIVAKSVCTANITQCLPTGPACPTANTCG